MEIEAALYDELVNDAGVSALVGTRIYPLLVPQEQAYPAVAYQVISKYRTASQSGKNQIVEARIQYTINASTYTSLRSVAAAVRAALEGFTGVMGGVGGVDVHSCYWDNEVDGAQTVNGAAVTRMDLLVEYTEA